MTPNGWLIIDKPLGKTSADVTNRLKFLLKHRYKVKKPKADAAPATYAFPTSKGVKIGHGGTLDPTATGILPIAIGEATKSMAFMLDADKTYEFTVAFGTQTHTDDAAGQPIAHHPHRPTQAEIQAVLAQFTGDIEQIPPAVSALWVEGERAYMLAHKGKLPNLAARGVTVKELNGLSAVLWVEPPSQRDACPENSIFGRQAPSWDHLLPTLPLAAATFIATVSKGTYIRSLARDMASALGTVGHVSMLRRTAHGPFRLAQAVSMEQAEAALQEWASQVRLDEPQKTVQKPTILPVDAGLDDLPAHVVDTAAAKALRFGHGIPLPDAASGCARVYAEEGKPENLVAVVSIANGTAKPQRVFNL